MEHAAAVAPIPRSGAAEACAEAAWAAEACENNAIKFSQI